MNKPLPKKTRNLTAADVKMSGFEGVIAMFRVMEMEFVEKILQQVNERDPELCARIRKEIFTFNDLGQIDDRSLQELLKTADKGKLALAMKLCSDELRKKIFKNMPKRAAELLRGEFEEMGPKRKKDVESAQKDLLDLARQLEVQGKIYLKRG